MAAGHRNAQKKEIKTMENIEQKNLKVTESKKLYERYESGNNRTPGELRLMMEFTESAGNVFSENMINDMADLGFFRYPASQTFHGTQDGGLYEHSMAVFRQLRYFTSHLDLKWQRPESPLLIGIFHDWAKLQNYEQIGSEDDLRYIHSTERLFPGHVRFSLWPAAMGRHVIDSRLHRCNSGVGIICHGSEILPYLLYGSIARWDIF